jgi:hypothetical protein
MENISWTKYFGKTYIQHEASPLSHTEVPKVEQIFDYPNFGSMEQLPFQVTSLHVEEH